MAGAGGGERETGNTSERREEVVVVVVGDRGERGRGRPYTQLIVHYVH